MVKFVMHRRESGISQDIRGCGWSLVASGGGGESAATVAARGGGETRGESLLRVRLCVSFISTDIIMALRGRS